MIITTFDGIILRIVQLIFLKLNGFEAEMLQYVLDFLKPVPTR